MKNTNNKSLDKNLISISLAFVISLVAVFYIFPDSSQRIADLVNKTLAHTFGSFVLLFVFFALFGLIALAFSKYGSIKLGQEKPEYSTFAWVAMMFSCGFGSAIFWWALIEWSYYIKTPGLNVLAESKEAYKMAVPYVFFHWGSSWTVYILAALPTCYHFYVKKGQGLSLSAVLGSMFSFSHESIFARIVDILFIFLCFGALSITLGISVPLITNIFCSVFDITPSFYMNVLMIFFISLTYSFSSYIGIEKGMKNLSEWNVKFALIFLLAVFAFGPSQFIMKNTVQSLGIALNYFPQMSLFTDPINNSGFPESWTIFVWLYAVTYAPFTGVFVTKVSRGRTLRALVINTIGSGTAGTLLFFGVLSSFSLQRQISGVVDVVNMVDKGLDKEAVVALLNSLPFTFVFAIAACVMMILFLATTLDGAAYTLSSTSTKNMKEGEDTSPFLRLFWCVMLSLVPLTMIFIKANLNTIKTAAVATAVPIVFIIILMLYGWLRWMFKDYKDKSEHDIIKEYE